MCPPNNDESQWLREYLTAQFKAQGEAHVRTDEKIAELRQDSQEQHNDHSARLKEIDTTLGRLTDTVVIHEKRSFEQEKKTEILQTAIKPMLDEHTLEAQLKARRVARWKTIGMVIGMLAAAAELIRSLLGK